MVVHDAGRDLVTRGEAGPLLGWSVSELKRWMLAEPGWPPPVRKDGKALLYDLAELLTVRERLHPRRVRHWTEQEDAVLCDLELTAQEVADCIDRTVVAVKTRRSKLEVVRYRHPIHDQWLLAKTCIVCGVLRQRDEFLIAGRLQRRVSTCSTCWPALLAERAAVVQARTARSAGHHGAEWTGPEIEIVLRPDLTAEEVAAMLGRTYNAVVTARWKAKHLPAWIERFHL